MKKNVNNALCRKIEENPKFSVMKGIYRTNGDMTQILSIRYNKIIHGLRFLQCIKILQKWDWTWWLLKLWEGFKYTHNGWIAKAFSKVDINYKIKKPHILRLNFSLFYCRELNEPLISWDIMAELITFIPDGLEFEKVKAQIDKLHHANRWNHNLIYFEF